MASVLQTPQAQTVRRPHNINWKFAIGGVAVLGIIVFVMFSSFQSNTVYYYTVQELYGQQAALAGQTVRVNGPLDKSSIQIDQKNLILKFNIKDGAQVLPVVYQGVAPDTMGTGESIVAEGKLGANGIFQANTILVKCPSKYEKSTVQ
jgi:cytochrome c-type biogenesis protein CcmE